MKTIAIVSHDANKPDCAEWVKFNASLLWEHRLVCTGTTGKVVENALREILGDSEVDKDPRRITKLKSGPLGGDQQIGAMVACGEIDMLVFFCDPLSVQSHYQDIGALERISVVYNIPFAANRSSADMILSSPLFSDENYVPTKPNHDNYINRKIC